MTGSIAETDHACAFCYEVLMQHSASADIPGPFSVITGRIAEALHDALLPGPTTDSLYWPLPLPTAVIAAVFPLMREGRGPAGEAGRAAGIGAAARHLQETDEFRPIEGE